MTDATLSCQLFSDVFFEDPFLVRDVGLSVVESVAAEEKTGKERQLFVAEAFGKLLELVTLRHRLIEAATDTTALSQLSPADGLVFRDHLSEMDVKCIVKVAAFE